MIKLIFAILLTAFTFFSYGQTKIDKDKERINSVCDKFMQNFQNGKISEAMQLLKQNSVMAHSTLDTLQETIADQINNIFPTYGKILSYEFILERKIKDFFARRFYILKFDIYYLKFEFSLYNNGQGWKITSFNYNEDLVEVLY